jgi:hypothetical protein
MDRFSRVMLKYGAGRRPVPEVFCLLLTTCLAGAARADDSDPARRKFDEGIAALKAEDFPGALTAFEASYRIRKKASVLYNIAMCQKALFRYTEAIATLEKLVRDSPAGEVDTARAEEIEAALRSLRDQVGRIAITVDVDGATVLLDGRVSGGTPLKDAVMVDPGRHVVEVRKEGFSDFRQEIELSVGEAREMAVSLVEVPARDASPPAGTAQETPVEEREDDSVSAAKGSDDGAERHAKRDAVLLTSAIFTLALGAGGITVGGVFLHKWNDDFNRTSSAAKDCKRSFEWSCYRDHSYYSSKLEGERIGIVAGFVTGGALVAAGAVLMTLRYRQKSRSPRVALAVTPRGVGFEF